MPVNRYDVLDVTPNGDTMLLPEPRQRDFVVMEDYPFSDSPDATDSGDIYPTN